jgi:carbamoyltransferase
VTTILGVNFFSHDTAACLLVDGRPELLMEQERLNRDVHTKQYPAGAIDSCLERVGASMADVDAVAVAQRPLVDLARGAGDAVARGAPKRLAAQTYTDLRLLARVRLLRRRWGYRGPVHLVGHHDAHAAGAFYPSGFDEAAVLTVDRGGDFLSTTLWSGRDRRLEPLAAVRNPHSLGELYTAVTVHLGFRAGSDEGKVMGLAPYGSTALVDTLRPAVRLTGDGLFRIDLSWFGWHRQGPPIGRPFVERFGPARIPESEITQHHMDLARAVQEVLEDSAVHVGRGLRRRAGSPMLCLSGGVALNSVMNNRVFVDAEFDDVFIQPAASDAGNALGAALWVWHHHMGRPREWTMEHAYLGVSWSEADLRSAFAGRGVSYRRVGDPAAEAARLVAAGKVVGWFQGRAEVGPRALGARSILADPRRPDMRDIVNHRVKRREWFRPFAPSVLAEHADEWFDGYHPNPFMLLVQPVRPEKRDLVPSITHVDGSARLQTVTEATSPLYHRLVSEFHRLTGVPMVLNTSFNLRGEPMVHRPEEALDDYLRSGMDAVILGDCLAEKQPLEVPAAAGERRASGPTPE